MDLPLRAPTKMTVKDVRSAFPTVDVPDHAHYTIGTVILIVGITGTLGNFLVIYAFCRSRTLQKPANIFIINLAVSDFLMSITQSPVFFTNSLHKRWIFGEKGCELYAFCGALFGITSMITLMVIALDRYFVITKPLASVRVMSKKKALIILVGVWLYSLAWSLPPFFGWSAYVPEGLLTSCSWDYMTFTPSVRAYTMLLFCFVFFIPLIAIIYSYFFIFEAIKKANKSIQTFGCKHGNKDLQKQYHRMKNEWKLAKIALIVILLYVISWSPYSVVALVAFAGYSHVLTPFMNSIPAVIAKASAIHNPIIYAITHPKYRTAIATYVPCLGSLLRVSPKESRSFSSSRSSRRTTISSQSSETGSGGLEKGKRRLSSISDSESGCTDTETDITSMTSRPASSQVSYEMGKDTTQTSGLGGKPEVKSHNSEIFGKTIVNTDEIPMVEMNVTEHSATSTCKASEKCSVEESQRGESLSGIGLRKGEPRHRTSASQIPSIIITCSNVQGVELPSGYSTGFLYPKNKSHKQNKSSSS
ncbi:melanopsin isoform X1 [Centrocercus urophasianus]|uniref:melanopsin isoform X1 n=2 Tax=Centrocercus urophasianus TaxID=9002 RepID=UPI001C64F2C7|nr:melanopsin isoform X1 [Centrocercus urophasianus]XP_042674643.1 melanopsin isoform X1 [Centrocercus urophasianus]XP_042674644.1 melanopsin isoform X1 [Centrocercus urophasianus]XP_042674645.1 melanopsin isoform X1 [Centrocercus urophasianus]XP_042674646.1 melanopsin isoform X1 [Centrocercus urophasianus]